MSPSSFVRDLAAVSLPNVFNPYSDTCDSHDKKDAAVTRRRTLRTYLESALSIGVDTIWMGRDLGYRGGRRTGVALTDEVHLPELPKLYPGCQSSQATRGPALAERTAAEIWAVLRVLERPPLLWNVFPFHPYETGNPFTNRRFTAKELREVDDLNATLISWLGIKRIIGIGQDAAQYADRFAVNVLTVRHPSYGGVNEFRAGIRTLYGLGTIRTNQQCHTQVKLF
jgi:hypothetical protein